MKCDFCKKKEARVKYCSAKCVKRAWWVRNHSNTYWGNDISFWDTETGKGLYWERYIATLIGAESLLFNGSDADLDWNGKKVDVKSAELGRRKNKRGKPVKSEQSGVWTFNRGKEKPIDFFFCVCLVEGKVEKILKVPSEEFSKSGLCVGWNSKFNKFIYKTVGGSCTSTLGKKK